MLKLKSDISETKTADVKKNGSIIPETLVDFYKFAKETKIYSHVESLLFEQTLFYGWFLGCELVFIPDVVYLMVAFFLWQQVNVEFAVLLVLATGTYLFHRYYYRKTVEKHWGTIRDHFKNWTSNEKKTETSQ